MILSCVSSIDWNVVSNILASFASIFTIGCLVWGVRAWRREFVGKRRIELGDDARAKFYAVRDAIAFIRNWNLTSTNEDDFNYSDVFRNRYTTTEDTFLRFQDIKHRVMATFDKDTESIFAEVNEICWKMQEASSNADMFKVHIENETDIAKRRNLQDRIEEEKDVFMERIGHKNEIKEKLDRIGIRLEEATRAISWMTK